MEPAAGGARQQRQNKASAGKKEKKGGGSGGIWPAVRPKKDLQINRLKGTQLLTVSAPHPPWPRSPYLPMLASNSSNFM
jgi:hypothetical protein